MKMWACWPIRRSQAAFFPASISPVKSQSVHAATQAYVDLAARHGIDPSQLALAFCLTRPFMAAAIIGATSMEQLKINIGAADVTLSDEILREINKIHRQYPMPI